MAIVLELCEYGSLNSFLQANDHGKLQVIQLVSMMRQIAAGNNFVTFFHLIACGTRESVQVVSLP